MLPASAGYGAPLQPPWEWGTIHVRPRQYCAGVAIQVGSQVKLGGYGVSVFRVVELDYDGDPDRALIQSVEDVPGSYPFPAKISTLHPVDG